ncbi:Pkinase-domain-containing protein [Wolfiporia cocos MD-104 SS10]|uniref:Pkinase-domain-containing protein n=1 Tax=Wolfiporia cocos (strain MD-104) TaxID=742152 RepID=A0A2H3JGH1_WOLCO|nr:Pkinase-domain-containing protein [Wolfiporia cocos MD-104 SS10]
MAANGHRHSTSVSQNHKAQLANAYNELGKELSSQKIRVVGNYTLGKVIGEVGTYGKVRLGVHRLSGTRVAIKQIPKAMSATLTREIHHHRQLHHPHVTQLYEVIATESNIWLVTELCSGGELFDYLTEKGRLNEDETRIIFGQLCLAVAYVHSKGIVHRDLKLENVLLDERCCVKLGDFGFTREFERGALLETFCGTTGYASPEMLLAKRYLGPGKPPQVDVWSLGVILYTLLTGTLPFDDDDEDVMKEKVISGVFEDPEWLSDESRDLIKAILQTDPEKRLTIAAILAHPWFTAMPVVSLAAAPSESSLSLASQPASPNLLRPTLSGAESQPQSSQSGASDTTYHSASSEFPASVPTSPIRSSHEEPSEPKQVDTQPGAREGSRTAEQSPSRPLLARHGSSTLTISSKAPPAYPTRTPVRTKRRSVSSTLSDPATPTFEKSLAAYPQDFSSLLNTPAPLIFSTPLEQELLNSMSALGLDTGQIVHSVLSNACDATGSLWWLLKRKAEKRVLEGGVVQSTAEPAEVREEEKRGEQQRHERRESKSQGGHTSHEHHSTLPTLVQAHSAPDLQFIPPTPTVSIALRPSTPPRSKSPGSQLLSPTPSVSEISRSHPSTPAGSVKDKDTGSKGRKARSGSVSIMQRATTALEAAGLVRKKSTEGTLREDKDKERGSDRRGGSGSGEEPRASHGSGGSGKAKSPPLKPKDMGLPSTPPSTKSDFSGNGSPWVVTNQRASPPPGGTDSPQDTLSALPNITGNKNLGHRNRASLLSTFRLWFKEDPKGKRKEDPGSSSHPYALNSPSTSPVTSRNSHGIKRRASGNRGRISVGRQTGPRSKRTSASSRRSSSVNSRRSSMHSTHFPIQESPIYGGEGITPVSRRRSDASRRSFGSHTPSSEKEDHVSRPSSIVSFTNQRHRKSPSASSAGSLYPGRTNSPLPNRLHNRGGSGSSTRVVRQIHTPALSHLRSNSTSSAHSMTSSRPGSFYEQSESDSRRNSSPSKRSRRRSGDEAARRVHSTTSFVAQKRQTPFANPGSGYLNSLGRSSWKKSWGLEPPGWQTRAAYSAIEVLAISPPVDGQQGIRDVFAGSSTGRPSLGDESDWVDEDDDGPIFGYAGGLGQMPHPALSVNTGVGPGTSYSHSQVHADVPVLSPAPRGSAARGKRTGLSPVSMSGRNARGKAGRSPGERSSPLPQSESFEPVEQQQRIGRRQLPNGRAGPAFRQAIQEEDEGEEE